MKNVVTGKLRTGKSMGFSVHEIPIGLSHGQFSLFGTGKVLNVYLGQLEITKLWITKNGEATIDGPDGRGNTFKSKKRALKELKRYLSS